MGNASSHGAIGAAGGALGAALLAILVSHFHMDPALASAWITLVAAVVVTPLLAYLQVKGKTDPALAAALAALSAGGGNGSPTVEATPTQTLVTNPPPVQPTVPPVVKVLPSPAADPAPGSQTPHGAIDAPSS